MIQIMTWLQEWTLQSKDGQPVTLTFHSFDVGTILPAPSTGTNYIWSPNYPNYYDDDYQQVKSLPSTMNIEDDILGMENTVNNRRTCHTDIRSIPY